MLSFDYDDHQEITWEKYGETLPPDKAISMLRKADQCRKGKPLFTYFLDGSRHNNRTNTSSDTISFFVSFANVLVLSFAAVLN
mgnify:CR=1 FL=1